MRFLAALVAVLLLALVLSLSTGAEAQAPLPYTTGAAAATSCVTIGDTEVCLGGAAMSLSGLTGIDSTTGTFSGNLTTNITGPTPQCVRASATGVLSGTGKDCVIGGGGTINSGSTPQIAQYQDPQGSPSSTVGPATISGDASLAFGGALTLATVNSNIGTFAATTITAKGLTTAGANLSGDATTIASTLTLANTPAARADIGLGTAASPTFTGLTLSGISGSTQCLDVNSSGTISGTGAPCGSGGGGGIAGPGTTVAGYVPQWVNTSGNNLGSGLPAGTTGNSTLVETNSSGLIANSLISGLPNASLANSSITIGSTNVALGATAASLAGLTNIGSGTGSFSGQLTSTLATGTAPFVIASTTNVANLNASSLSGNTFAAPGAIGSSTPNTAAFTNETTSGSITANGLVSGTVVAGKWIGLNSSNQMVLNTPSLVGTSTNGQLLTNSSGNVIGTNVGTTGVSTVVETDAGGHIANSLITGLPNANLANSSITIGSTNTALGATSTSLAGLTGISSTTGTFSGQLTSTVTTGTAPLVVTSTTNVANLNASSLSGNTFHIPGPIGDTTPGSGNFTSGGFTGTLSTNITGSTQCVHASSTGILSGTGSDCGAGTGGGVGTSTNGQLLINSSGSIAGLNVGTTGVSTVVETNSSGLIANSLISGLPNADLANSSVTIGSTNVALGATAASLSGLTGIGSTTGSFTGNLTTNITGSTQCVHVSSTGILSGTGADCNTASSGLSGMTAGQIPIAATPTTITSSQVTGTTGNSVILQTDASGNEKAPINTTAAALSGQLTSTLTTGTAPFVIASTTNVANLNASSLNGATFAAPGAIGSTTPGSGNFTSGGFTGTLATNITGSTQCVHASSTGVLSGTGTDCSSIFANPTATASDTAVNGTATTTMRSDAAPAVQKASASQFGIVKVDGTTITAPGGVISGPTGANPTASASDVAINGTATTFMRSDASPAIQKMSSTQFGIGKVDGTSITATGGVISGPAGANPTAAAGDIAVNGSATTFMRSDAAPVIQKASAAQFGIAKVDGTTITASGGVISAAASYTPTVYVGTVAGTNSYTSTPTQTYSANTPYNVFCGQFTNANTSAATLNLNSTGAITIAKQINGALLSVTGGEIQGGATTQCFQLNGAGTAWTMQAAPTGGVTPDPSAHTVSVVEWAYGQIFTFSTAGKTLTLPPATTLSANGLIAISTVGQSVSLAPQSTDGINGGAVNTPLVIPANSLSIVTTSGVAGTNAFSAPINPAVSCAQLPALTGDVTTAAGSCATTSTWHKISTQTASAAASIAWTGLGTTYNEYVLECPYIYPAVDNDQISLQVGEGATPTWQAANYQWQQSYVSSAASPTITPASSGGADTGFVMAAGGSHNVVTDALSVHASIYNIPSTTYYTSVRSNVTLYSSLNSVSYLFTGGGTYSGDTTAKTALRLVASTGNITGSCSLWGIVVP